MSKKSAKRPVKPKIIENQGNMVWTPAMDLRAKSIAKSKKQSIELLKRAGILNEQGQLAKEYAD